MSRALLASAIATLLLSCGPEATLPPDSFEPIRIGVVTSLSGTLGTDGPGWADAARLAALEINAAGGPLPGRPIELVVLDDETNPDLAEGLATRLVEQEGVVGLIGAAASSISMGLADVATESRIPQISCCSTSDLLTELNREQEMEDRFFFRTAPSDILQARVVAIAAEDLECSALAVLHLDDSYGQPFGEAIETSFEGRGGTVVTRVPFTDGQASYATEVEMVHEAAPDCIALVAFPGSAGLIVRAWEAIAGAPDVTWIGTDGVRVPGFVDEAGSARVIDGFFGTSPVTDAQTPEYNAFRAHYRAVFGQEPIPFSSNQYDAVALLALAIAHAGTTEGPAVRDALHEVSTSNDGDVLARGGELADALARVREGRGVDYHGSSGNTDFDELGDVVTPYEIWRYDAPDSTLPCDDATVLDDDKGRFCRFRVINAEDISG